LKQILELWEPFVHQAFEAQTATFKAWVDGLAATPNAPEPLKAQLLQMQELSQGWTESQRQMWDTMFTMLRQIATTTQPPSMMPLMPGLDMWQKATAPMLEAYAAWLRQSTNLVSGPSGVRPGQASGRTRG
jgi:hypothetical protein